MSFLCGFAQVDIALAAAHKRAEPPILAAQLQVSINATAAPGVRVKRNELQRAMHRAPALGAAQGLPLGAMDGLARDTRLLPWNANGG
jgi:hypothetical protein